MERPLQLYVLGKVEGQSTEAYMGRAATRSEYADLVASTGYVGSWRWLIDDNRVMTSSRVAALYGISAADALKGFAPERVRLGVHPSDRERYSREVASSAATGRDMNFVYRAGSGREFVLVRATGTCIRLHAGRPAEFLGAVHRVGKDDVIEMVSGLLVAAATALPPGHAPDLSFFIDMALLEAGNELAARIRAH